MSFPGPSKESPGFFLCCGLHKKPLRLNPVLFSALLCWASPGPDGSGTSDFLNKFRVMRQVILTNEVTYTAFIFFRRSFT
jgi:hypothetical protein